MAVATSTRMRSTPFRSGWVVDGFDAVADDFARAGVTAGLRAARVVVTTAHDIEATMKDLVPKRSKQLHDSITATEPGGGPLGAGSLEAEIGPENPKGFYGYFLEFGTSKMSPRPFVFPALDQHMPSYVAAMEQIAGEVFDPGLGGNVLPFPSGLSGSLRAA